MASDSWPRKAHRHISQHLSMHLGVSAPLQCTQCSKPQVAFHNPSEKQFQCITRPVARAYTTAKHTTKCGVISILMCFQVGQGIRLTCLHVARWMTKSVATKIKRVQVLEPRLNEFRFSIHGLFNNPTGSPAPPVSMYSFSSLVALESLSLWVSEWHVVCDYLQEFRCHHRA